MERTFVVADASVLVNFLRIDRMDLIGRHPDSFIATDHVADEITYPDQRRRYAAAIARGHIVQERVDDPVELEIFMCLSRGGTVGCWRAIGHCGGDPPGL